MPRGFDFSQDFWPLKVYFGPLRLDLGLYEYILSLCGSILGLWELFSGLYVHFGNWEFILGQILGVW